MDIAQRGRGTRKRKEGEKRDDTAALLEELGMERLSEFGTLSRLRENTESTSQGRSSGYYLGQGGAVQLRRSTRRRRKGSFKKLESKEVWKSAGLSCETVRNCQPNRPRRRRPHKLQYTL